ncbi:MAG TPA: hypothetical protein VGR21_14090, partial [Cryptosporangiaceae bacterium]|nr:hypothetical protein [Cryptosporangiaceae bacterium]
MAAPTKDRARPGAAAGAGLAAWAGLGVVYVVWGSTYLAIKISVETLPPLLSSAVRFLGAGVVLLVVLA